MSIGMASSFAAPGRERSVAGDKYAIECGPGARWRRSAENRKPYCRVDGNRVKAMESSPWQPTPFVRRCPVLAPGGWFSDFWQMASYSSGTVPDLHRTCPFEPRIIPAAPPGMCRMYLSLEV